ncbi:MAG: PAS domain S-box protein [Caldiserica bacterium]|nr:PAS domain S-box protein [Caldisericota bacterium]
MIIVNLIYNLALLVALSVISGFIGERRQYLNQAESLLQGFLFGSAAVIGMLLPLRLAPGLIFDGRSVVISLCALFFGPVAAALAIAMAATLRIIQSGPGAIMGVSVILESGLIGLAFHAYWTKRDGDVSVRQLLVFGLLVHAVMIALTATLPAGMRLSTLRSIGLPVMLTYPLATVLIGKILSDHAAQGRFLRELHESESKFRTLAESTPMGILLYQDDKWIYANPAATDITGYSIDELLSMNFWDFIHPDYKDIVKERGRKRERGEDTVQTYEFKIVTRDGGQKWVQLFGTSTKMHGRSSGLITVLDTTERKRAEVEKAKLEEQYRQSQKMESVGRLAGGVAHDLNNLLTPILGFGGLLLDDLRADDPHRESVQQIVRAAEKSRDLVRQLMAFGRKQVLEFKPLNLNTMLVEFEELLRHTLREDIALKFVLAPSIPALLGDVGQLEQVVMNLAVNAQDAMPEGGGLTIETGVADLDTTYAADHQGVLPGHYVLLVVSDIGMGMDAETQEHIFEPFFTTKEMGKGTGLGLATVYGIVKQHGGNIWVYSEPGKGTTFKVYLPVVETSPEPVEKVRVTPFEDLRGTETILLAEDDAVVRSLARGVLEQQGYTVLRAANGREALSVLASYGGTVQLLLSDVVMPEMNGKELFANIVKNHPAIKVLYMSGYTENVIAHRGVLDAGVQFIQKPFTVHALTAKVRETLDDGQQRSQ